MVLCFYVISGLRIKLEDKPSSLTIQMMRQKKKRRKTVFNKISPKNQRKNKKKLRQNQAYLRAFHLGAKITFVKR